MNIEHDPFKGCDGCPFYRLDLKRISERVQLIPSCAAHNDLAITPPVGPAPDWCPLEEGPVTVHSPGES